MELWSCKVTRLGSRKCEVWINELDCLNLLEVDGNLMKKRYVE